MTHAHTDRVELDRVTILFSGDSGDGMQLTGANFTDDTALFGNDLSTFPDFPAEIRAPAGSTFGVSAFQIYFGSEGNFTAYPYWLDECSRKNEVAHA